MIYFNVSKSIQSVSNIIILFRYDEYGNCIQLIIWLLSSILNIESRNIGSELGWNYG